jgi:hypothetical protein
VESTVIDLGNLEGCEEGGCENCIYDVDVVCPLGWGYVGFVEFKGCVDT